jgi:putative membrane protein
MRLIDRGFNERRALNASGKLYGYGCSTMNIRLLTVAWMLSLALSWALVPFNWQIWAMEIAPVVLAWPVLWATGKRFPLTPLLYGVILVHGLILIVGGHYTYARVPLGLEVAEFMGWSRNPYDKLGHFFQGLVPALLARELLLRRRDMLRGGMLFFVCVCVALAVSAVYELLEWWVAVGWGDGAIDFLGVQGDVWDAQSDMLMAWVGATIGLLAFSRLQDRQLH